MSAHTGRRADSGRRRFAVKTSLQVATWARCSRSGGPLSAPAARRLRMMRGQHDRSPLPVAADGGRGRRGQADPPASPAGSGPTTFVSRRRARLPTRDTAMRRPNATAQRVGRKPTTRARAIANPTSANPAPAQDPDEMPAAAPRPPVGSNTPIRQFQCPRDPTPR
jgi:hypothetical protein